MNYVKILGIVSLLCATPAAANDFETELTALANGKILEIASSELLIEAILTQNQTTSSYSQSQIDALDQQWRAEVDASERPLIDGTLENSTSQFLMGVQDESQGLFSEIFAMDAVGLNVGQSSVTSDYWQGDEAKWQNTFGSGAGSIEIGDIEEDESTQTFQSQVSVTVVDDSGKPIGAITFGVNVEAL